MMITRCRSFQKRRKTFFAVKDDDDDAINLFCSFKKNALNDDDVNNNLRCSLRLASSSSSSSSSALLPSDADTQSFFYEGDLFQCFFIFFGTTKISKKKLNFIFRVFIGLRKKGKRKKSQTKEKGGERSLHFCHVTENTNSTRNAHVKKRVDSESQSFI